MRKPPITISCDCGQSGSTEFGQRWQCGGCGSTWNTAQIPADEYAALLRGVRRYRLLAIAPPLAAAAVLLPLSAALPDIRFAILFFGLVTAWALFVMPQLRRRRARRILESAPRWNLRPDLP